MNLGRSWWTIAALVSSLATFYLATWEEYHTKRLYLGVISGPVEGILMIIGVFIVSGLYGE
jgi:ethanolaminephosphotransferase